MPWKYLIAAYLASCAIYVLWWVPLALRGFKATIDSKQPDVTGLSPMSASCTRHMARILEKEWRKDATLSRQNVIVLASITIVVTIALSPLTWPVMAYEDYKELRGDK